MKPPLVFMEGGKARQFGGCLWKVALYQERMPFVPMLLTSGLPRARGCHCTPPGGSIHVHHKDNGAPRSCAAWQPGPLICDCGWCLVCFSFSSFSSSSSSLSSPSSVASLAIRGRKEGYSSRARLPLGAETPPGEEWRRERERGLVYFVSKWT